MTEQQLIDQELGELLIRSARAGFEYEHQIDRSRFLGNTEEVTNSIWVCTPDHWAYVEGSKTFIVTLLPEWDEEEDTYEEWRDNILPCHISFEVEPVIDLEGYEQREVEELREGSYWTTFLVRYSK